jgi:nucleotide-binding universal stress UspA family protein
MSGRLAAMRPVLLYYDGSDHAARAIQCAGALLRPRDAIVLHVAQKPFKDDVADAGRRVALAAGFDPLAVVDAGHGHMPAAIREEAQRRDVSVIVVGSPRRALGSLSAIVHQAQRPLLVGPPAGASSPPNAPIFMCYDGSREARHALSVAGDLLVGRSASVAAFMPAVDDLAVLRSSLPRSVGPEAQDRLARVDRQEAEAAAERAGEGTRIAATAGFAAQSVPIPAMSASSEEEEEPRRRLLRAAADEEAACIVAGHRPASNGFGSTAYGLVHHADRPVLVVPGAP